MRTLKSLLSVTALAFVGLVFSATAAQAQLTSGNAIVTVTVADVLALQVANPAVALSLGSVTDLANGSTFTATAQLVANSNRAFDIKVKSDGNLVGTLTAAGSSIPIANLRVQASPTLANTFTTALTMSSSDQLLITNATAGLAKAYDVKYSMVAGSSDYNVPTGAYIATLTFSISAH